MMVLPLGRGRSRITLTAYDRNRVSDMFDATVSAQPEAEATSSGNQEEQDVVDAYDAT